MGKSLTEAQKKGERIRGKGHSYHGGFTRDEYLFQRRMSQESLDGISDSPRDKYVSRVHEMLDFLDRINPPAKEWIKRSKNGKDSEEDPEEVSG